ncbi:MAG: peptidyl-prolyl cis-trans isomerase [Caulobacteraceae bacterium]|nr:peptidyl-prolyl cis-trans isomerase [Caulobacteraceae bacterium]
MLAAIRSFAKTKWAAGLFVLLILSFVTFNIRDMLHAKISTAVVTAGSREVSGSDFKRVFDNALKQVSQQQGQQVTLQDAVAAGFDKRVLSDLESSEAFAEYLRRIGVTPADKLVGDAIAKQPMFFDKLTGKFDQKAYESTLAQNNLTPKIYESLLRDELAQNHLAAGIGTGLKAPKTYGALIAAYGLESRNLSYFILDPHNVAPPTPPTDQELQTFLNQNAAALKRPEMRILTVVRFSAKAMAASMPVDEAAVTKLYNFRKDAASAPEKRSLAQIPVKDAATALAVAAKLKAGQDPAAVAKSIGAQPIVYTDAPKSGIGDPKIADAAFAMKTGDVSGLVQGALGMGVIKITDIKPAHVASLEEMRPQLEAQVKADTAGQKVYALVQKYEDAHSGGASMADSARAAGAAPESIGPITAQGTGLTGQPAPGLTQKLMQEAFKTPQGGESDLISESSGEYFAIRVEKVLPPAVPALAEVKEPLTRDYMITEMSKRLQAKAEELTSRVRKGESFESVAASVGAKVGQAAGVTRTSLQQNKVLGPDMSQKIFAAKKGEVFSGATAQVAVMVAKLDDVQPPAPAQAAMLVAQESDTLTGQLFQDIGLMLRNSARAKIKPVSDLARARSALGLSADTLPKDTPPKDGGKPASGSPAS